MSVSLDHELMVLYLLSWLDGDEAPIKVQTVSTECSLYSKIKLSPPTIYGHKPDLYAMSKKHNGECLIGEIKTTRDLESNRTEVQLNAFAEHLYEIGCGYLVLGVPWNSVPSAKSLLKKILSDKKNRAIKPLVVDCSSALLRRDL